MKAEFKEKTKVLKNGLHYCLFVCFINCHTMIEITNDVTKISRKKKWHGDLTETNRGAYERLGGLLKLQAIKLCTSIIIEEKMA